MLIKTTYYFYTFIVFTFINESNLLSFTVNSLNNHLIVSGLSFLDVNSILPFNRTSNSESYFSHVLQGSSVQQSAP